MREKVIRTVKKDDDRQKQVEGDGLGTNECQKKLNETSSQEFNGSSNAENGNMKTSRQTLLHMNDESRLNMFEFIWEIIIIVIITLLCCHGGRSTPYGVSVYCQWSSVSGEHAVTRSLSQLDL